MNLKRFFGKDYKFFWRYESPIGNIYGVILNRLGIMLLRLARILIRKGGGKFRGVLYSNCSWCGGVQTYESGLHMHVGSKGSRCGITNAQCYKQPKV